MLALNGSVLNLIVGRRIPCASQRRRNLIQSAHGPDSPAKNWICALSASPRAAARKDWRRLDAPALLGSRQARKKQGYDLSVIPLSHINEQAEGYTLFGPDRN